MENNCRKGTSAEIKISKQVMNFSYKWVISDIGSRCSSESPIFSNETNDLSWRIKIDSRNQLESSDENQSGHLGSIIHCVKLFLFPLGATKIQAKCKFQLLNVIPDNTYISTKLLYSIPGQWSDCFKINRNVLLDPENGFVQDGKIILTCDIKASEAIFIPRAESRCSLTDDFERLFENRKYSDVTLCASGQEFEAHKGILVSRSPVFRAMFEHEMEESKQNRVNIPDIDGKVFQELLRYIYTGRVLKLEEFAIDLLPAADKYELQRLKALCGEELCSNISIDSATKVLLLADLHKLDYLKTIAIEYIAAHAEDVCKTDGWNSLIRSYPLLIAEVLCDLSKHA